MAVISVGVSTTAPASTTSFISPDLKPALSPQVEVFLTAIFLALFSILFLSVYVQLYMILWYRHKRCSYQSVMLFMILIWAALRIVLFSMYFSEVYLANHLPLFISWLLYCLPICLQFFTLCLITSFFTLAYLKGQDIGQKTNRNLPNIFLGIAALLFFTVNITFATLSMKSQREQHEVILSYVYSRVIINDGLFLTVATFLIIAIVKLMKVPITKRSLEAKADVVNLSKGNAYLSFTTVLTIWEFLPLVVVLTFFRVKLHKSKDTIANTECQYFPDERASLLKNKFLTLTFRNLIRPHTVTRMTPLCINDVSHQLTSTYPPLVSPRYGTTCNSFLTKAEIHNSP